MSTKANINRARVVLKQEIDRAADLFLGLSDANPENWKDMSLDDIKDQIIEEIDESL